MASAGGEKSAAAESASVKVAIRVRPILPSLEKDTGSVFRYPQKNQVVLVKDPSTQISTVSALELEKSTFTYDYVFNEATPQPAVYTDAVAHLVKSFMDGYNATILAYGQTGSGKTFSMGTAANTNQKKDEFGIIPRVITQIFDTVKERDATHRYVVRVSFLEIHHEDLHDLLRDEKSAADAEPPMIREGAGGAIYVAGIVEKEVTSYDEMLSALMEGTERRTVGKTNMNATSSRSHAIFSVLLQQKFMKDDDDDEFLQCKFNFVDLAGSERLKRTGASGQRMKEGISINSGLLALGNVISALGDPTKRGQHVPFRDSKITRLLQDSLGGNSRTLMIACCSPADVNYDETINTLKYANRARNIKNKPVLNRDANSAKIAALKERIAQLEAALESKGGSVLPGGIAPAGLVNSVEYDRKCEENQLMDSTIKRQDERLKQQRSQLSECNDALLKANVGRDVAQLKFTRLVSVMRANAAVAPHVEQIMAAAAAIKTGATPSAADSGAATAAAAAGAATANGAAASVDPAAAIREFEFGVDDVAGVDVLTENRATIDKQRNKIRKLQAQVRELESFVTKLKKEFDSPTKRIQQQSAPQLILSADQIAGVTPAKKSKKKGTGKKKAAAAAAAAAAATASAATAAAAAIAGAAPPTADSASAATPATAPAASTATDSAPAVATGTAAATTTTAVSADATAIAAAAAVPTPAVGDAVPTPVVSATPTAAVPATGEAGAAAAPAAGDKKDEKSAAPATAAAGEEEEDDEDDDEDDDGLSEGDDDRDDDEEAELKSIKVLSDLKEREHQYRQGRLKEQERGLAGELSSKELLLRELEELEHARRQKSDVEAQVVEKERELERVNTEKESAEARQAKGEKLDDKQTEAIKQYKDKVAALQTQLNGLRQKLKESESAIRESKLKDQNIAKLRAEIQSMKTQKVTLAKQMSENSEKYRAWQQSQDLKLKTAQKEMRKQSAALAKLQSELTKQAHVVKQRNAQMDGLQKKLRDADLRNAKNAARQAKDAKDVKTPTAAGSAAVASSDGSMRPPALPTRRELRNRARHASAAAAKRRTPSSSPNHASGNAANGTGSASNPSAAVAFAASAAAAAAAAKEAAANAAPDKDGLKVLPTAVAKAKAVLDGDIKTAIQREELAAEVQELRDSQSYLSAECKHLEEKLSSVPAKEHPLLTTRLNVVKSKLAFVEIQLSKKRDAQAAVGRLFVGATATDSAHSSDHKFAFSRVRIAKLDQGTALVVGLMNDVVKEKRAVNEVRKKYDDLQKKFDDLKAEYQAKDAAAARAKLVASTPQKPKPALPVAFTMTHTPAALAAAGLPLSHPEDGVTAVPAVPPVPGAMTPVPALSASQSVFVLDAAVTTLNNNFTVQSAFPTAAATHAPTTDAGTLAASLPPLPTAVSLPHSDSSNSLKLESLIDDDAEASTPTAAAAAARAGHSRKPSTTGSIHERLASTNTVSASAKRVEREPNSATVTSSVAPPPGQGPARVRRGSDSTSGLPNMRRTKSFDSKSNPAAAAAALAAAGITTTSSGEDTGILAATAGVELPPSPDVFTRLTDAKRFTGMYKHTDSDSSASDGTHVDGVAPSVPSLLKKSSLPAAGGAALPPTVPTSTAGAAAPAAAKRKMARIDTTKSVPEDSIMTPVTGEPHSGTHHNAPVAAAAPAPAWSATVPSNHAIINSAKPSSAGTPSSTSPQRPASARSASQSNLPSAAALLASAPASTPSAAAAAAAAKAGKAGAGAATGDVFSRLTDSKSFTGAYKARLEDEHSAAASAKATKVVVTAGSGGGGAGPKARPVHKDKAAMTKEAADRVYRQAKKDKAGARNRGDREREKELAALSAEMSSLTPMNHAIINSAGSHSHAVPAVPTGPTTTTAGLSARSHTRTPSPRRDSSDSNGQSAGNSTVTSPAATVVPVTPPHTNGKPTSGGVDSPAAATTTTTVASPGNDLNVSSVSADSDVEQWVAERPNANATAASTAALKPALDLSPEAGKENQPLRRGAAAAASNASESASSKSPSGVPPPMPPLPDELVDRLLAAPIGVVRSADLKRLLPLSPLKDGAANKQH